MVLRKRTVTAVWIGLGLALALTMSAQVTIPPRMNGIPRSITDYLEEMWPDMQNVKMKVTDSIVRLERFTSGEYRLSAHIEVMINRNPVNNAMVFLDDLRMAHEPGCYTAAIRPYPAAAGKKIHVLIQWPYKLPYAALSWLTVAAETTPGVLLNVIHPHNGATISPADVPVVKIKWTKPPTRVDFRLYARSGGRSLVLRKGNLTDSIVEVPASLFKWGTRYEVILSTHKKMSLKYSYTSDSRITFEQTVHSRFRTIAAPGGTTRRR